MRRTKSAEALANENEHSDAKMRLIEGLRLVNTALSGPTAFENTKETTFSALRRGCLDLRRDISQLDAPEFSDDMIQNAWLFLIELSKGRLRRKHALECMNVMVMSDRWVYVLKVSDSVQKKLKELPPGFKVITEAASKPLIPTAGRQSSSLNLGSPKHAPSHAITPSPPPKPASPVAKPGELSRQRSSAPTISALAAQHSPSISTLPDGELSDSSLAVEESPLPTPPPSRPQSVALAPSLPASVLPGVKPILARCPSVEAPAMPAPPPQSDMRNPHNPFLGNAPKSVNAFNPFRRPSPSPPPVVAVKNWWD